METRVYYESIEQALFFVKPLLQKAGVKNIVLVKKMQQSHGGEGFRLNYSQNLTKLLIKKNPDITISVIENNVEIPVLMMEFSTAVFTKDHELQRTDNFMVAKECGCIYVKISSLKKASKKHGGDIDYNYIEPYALYLKKYSELAFHFDWLVEKDDASKLKRHPNYKSLPESIEHIDNLFQAIFSAKSFSNKTWRSELSEKLVGYTFFNSWINTLKKCKSYEDIKNINSDRTSWEDYSEDVAMKNAFTLKINRMGHAMDPERGMLAYYSFFLKEKNDVFISKMFFNEKNKAWFKDTSSEKEIGSYLEEQGIKTRQDLIKLFGIGLCIKNYDAIIKAVKATKDKIIDINDFVDSNYTNLNSPLRTIIDHSEYLLLTNGDKVNVVLTWNRKKRDFDYSKCPKITKISQRAQISEDDVTFITVNEVFKANGIDVVSVSYPGAQSDTPILPDKDGGRTQRRIYIDSIGLKDQELIFQENKGKFSKSAVDKDIAKIKLFKTNKAFALSVKTFAEIQGIKYKSLTIGVGFGESNNTPVQQVNIKDVDYFLVISSDLKKWKIFTSNTGGMFKKTTGIIDYPVTFSVDTLPAGVKTKIR